MIYALLVFLLLESDTIIFDDNQESKEVLDVVGFKGLQDLGDE